VRDTGMESLLNANEPQPVVLYQKVGLGRHLPVARFPQRDFTGLCWWAGGLFARNGDLRGTSRHLPIVRVADPTQEPWTQFHIGQR
jgi:hypothetical protein